MFSCVTCASPNSLVVNNITPNTADISWTPSGNETELELYQRGLYGENSENIDDIINESLYDNILLGGEVTDDMINRNIVSCSHEENSEAYNETCTICMENNTDCMLRGCLHKFHKNCITRWLKEKPCCPLCNKGIR